LLAPMMVISLLLGASPSAASVPCVPLAPVQQWPSCITRGPKRVSSSASTRRCWRVGIGADKVVEPVPADGRQRRGQRGVGRAAAHGGDRHRHPGGQGIARVIGGAKVKIVAAQALMASGDIDLGRRSPIHGGRHRKVKVGIDGGGERGCHRHAAKLGRLTYPAQPAGEHDGGSSLIPRPGTRSLHVPPSFERREHHEQVGCPLSDVLVIHAGVADPVSSAPASASPQ